MVAARAFALGLLVGAAGTGLAVYLFTPTPPPSEPVLQARAEPAPVRPPMSAAPALVPASAPGPEAMPRPPTRPGGPAGPGTPPPPPPDSPRGMGGPPEMAPPLPLPRLSTEHAELLKPRPRDGQPLTPPELHLQFVSERADPNWSLTMEQTLRQFIAQGNASGEFELLNVECRSTLCEITAFGNLPASGQRWNSVLAEMGSQPWWSQFQGNSTSTSGSNGRTTIVSILQRAKR